MQNHVGSECQIFGIQYQIIENFFRRESRFHFGNERALHKCHVDQINLEEMTYGGDVIQDSGCFQFVGMIVGSSFC
jgi:hypothetical protein